MSEGECHSIGTVDYRSGCSLCADIADYRPPMLDHEREPWPDYLDLAAWPREVPPPALAAELLDICRGLWPYVRAFGLCGANLESIALVNRLAVALGHARQPDATIDDAKKRAVNAAIEDIAEFVEAGPYHRQIPASYRREMVAGIRERKAK